LRALPPILSTVVVWKWRATNDPHTVTDVKKRFGVR
jgi:hypothetical protein